MADVIREGAVINDRYELESRLGEGAFGEVYKARDLNLARRPVAVKVLHKDLGRYAEIIERFENEAVALAHVQHANIVNIIDRGSWQGRRYFVTELVQGRTLQEVIDEHRAQRRGLDFDLAQQVFDQICAGVDEAHRLSDPGPIVHRDLKPSNVMLRTNDDEVIVKVLDFGVAQLGASHLTRTGVLLGTPYYMAPEQILGRSREVGPASDVFALGVLLTEMLVPGGGLADEETWWSRVLDDEAGTQARLESLRPEVPKAVWAAVAFALRKSSRDRFATAGSIRRAVRQAWKNTMPGDPKSEPRPATRESLTDPRAQRESHPHDEANSGPGGTLPDVPLLGQSGRHAPTDVGGRGAPEPHAARQPQSSEPDFGRSGAQHTVAWDGKSGAVGAATGGSSAIIATPPTRSGMGSTLKPLTSSPVSSPVGLAAVALACIGVGGTVVYFITRNPADETDPDAAGTNVVAPGPASEDVGPPPPPPCPESMVFVPAGSFLMGSPDGVGDPDERPQRQATVEAFCIDKTEVTTAAYRQCAESGRCSAVPGTVEFERASVLDKRMFDPVCNGPRPDRAEHPVNCMSWTAAGAFCSQRDGAALPTEEQWEYVAREGGKWAFPWGAGVLDGSRTNGCGAECVAKNWGFSTIWLDPDGNNCREPPPTPCVSCQRRPFSLLVLCDDFKPLYPFDDGAKDTAPVGSRKDGNTASGVSDLAGNVWEWTATVYRSGTNPNVRYVLKGGGFLTPTSDMMRGANRESAGPNDRYPDVGFRCVKRPLEGSVPPASSAAPQAPAPDAQQKDAPRIVP